MSEQEIKPVKGIEEKYPNLINPNVESYVSLKRINKVYPNGVQAVFDFNLDINQNDFVVFVGPSGCGKSTLLRMIAGLEEITAGELYISQVYSNNLSPKDRDIALVFQNYALYPHMSVYDNMAFGLKTRGVDKKIIDERVFNAAEVLQLTEYLDRKPKELSGGQMQRVALGRTIVRNAKIFMMDEPLSNLDAKLRVQMRGEIVRLHESLKATTIYVTHDQTEAMTMATKIVVMNKGHIQQIGSPTEVYNHPANIFVATFIGSPSMNIVDGTYLDGTITLKDGTKFKLPERYKTAHNEFYKREIEALKERLNNLQFECELLPHSVDKKALKSMKSDDVNNKVTNNDCEDKVSYSKTEMDEIKVHNIVRKAVATGSNKFSIKEIFKRKKTKLPTLEELIEQKRAEINDLIAIYESNLTQEHDIKFGIRPEDVKIASEKYSFEVSDKINLKVEISELLGSEYYAHATVCDNNFIAKIPSDYKVQSHDDIEVVLNLNKAHLFDIHNKKCID